MNVNRLQTAPVSYPRTRRNHNVISLTSFQPGKFVPIAAMPLLREDSFSGRFRIAVEMLETRELLMNPVNLRVTAYLIPLLAYARFEGSRDQFERSYMGQPKVDGGVVVPFVETQAMGTHGSNAVYKALGVHGKSTDLVATWYLEGYNLAWNLRAKNRSMKITPRTRLDKTLAPAFWHHSRFQHVVPDFDQAVIDGEVALDIAGNLALTGATAPVTRTGTSKALLKVAATGAVPATGNLAIYAGGEFGNTGNSLGVQLDPNGSLQVDLSSIEAELNAEGIRISLANIELAKKTQYFAKLRERYEGFDDEYIIDQLMSGLRIPDQHLKQPILVADQSVRIQQAKRYATDATNLTQSAVNGGAMLDISVRVPRIETGGIVMLFAEAVPEQLFERQRDPFLFADTVADYPDALRDTLDPEKVDVVLNGEIDTAHGTPTNTFGYAPMNWKWNAMGPRVGGKFYRPETDGATDTVRQRIWAVENINAALSADFYLVNSMHNKVFLDTVGDPFELSTVGNAVIEGNTQFGGVLVESTTNYDEVMEKAPLDRIVKP